MSNIPHAPISSPLNSQTYQLWLEQVGRHLNSQTTIKTKTGEDNQSKISYVVSGSITHINYTGTGGFTANLPTKCKLKSLIQVSDGTHISIESDSKILVIPSYTNEVTIHGSYFNEA